MTDAPAETLSGRRILLVEDDYFIAADLSGALERAGIEVVGPAGSVSDALRLIETDSPLDGAILDIHLGEERGFPVADDLTRRGVPFVFVSGYDSQAIPAPYADAPRCEKPVDVARLLRVLRKAGLR